MIGIYKITSPSGKVYIGQSVDIERRFKQYKRLSCKCQTKLYNSFMKHGVNSHCFEILKTFDEDQREIINDLELKYWKEFLDSGIELLNLKIPGNQSRHSEETKRKIGLAGKGKVYPHVAEIVRKALTGVKLSPERCKAISDGKKGKKHSEQHRANMSVSFKGRKISKEHLEKMLKAREGKPAWNKGTKGKQTAWNKGLSGYKLKGDKTEFRKLAEKL